MADSTPRRLLAALAWACALAPGSAGAQAELPPIVDRDYALDLYQGVAFGSTRIVGLGGAQVALAQGSAGMLINPAAPAVRPSTSRGDWDWDWHFDLLTAGLGSDFDNNGIADAGELTFTPLLTLGAVVQYKRFAVGVGFDYTDRTVAAEGIGDLQPSVTVGHLTFAVEENSLTAGIALRSGQFAVDRVSDLGRAQLFTLSGSQIEGGAIWHPRDRDLRLGVTVSYPVVGEEVVVQSCDPMDCEGLILPDRIQIPWRLSAGIAWRRADTRWNRKVNTRWRDERYVLLTADVVIDGEVEDGHGVEAFTYRKLQRSGEAPSVSVRGGVEYEWLPGRLRIRAGSYWEPGRFAGVSGRVHGTAGADIGLFEFCFWNERYRMRLSFVADVARSYGNTGLSLGFW